MTIPSDPASLKRLARRKLDKTGEQWRQLPSRLRLVPAGGWINAIRDALGMSQAELGQRLGVRPSSIGKIEENERNRSIQMDTLQRAADALDCDVVYALVPRKPLQTMVDNRRLALFEELHQRTQQHMRLEAQEVDDPHWRQNLLRDAEALIPDSRLWRKSS
ncbi:MAG: mobile mystery protein A [Pseudoxanthomonas sp.]